MVDIAHIVLGNNLEHQAQDTIEAVVRRLDIGNTLVDQEGPEVEEDKEPHLEVRSHGFQVQRWDLG